MTKSSYIHDGVVVAPDLANVLGGVAREVPANVLTTGVLDDVVVVDLDTQEDAAVVGELAAGSKTDVTAAIDNTALDGQVVAVLDEDGVVAVVGQVDTVDAGGAGHGDAEDSAPAATGLDLVDEDVGGGVAAVGDLAVVVGHTECGVAVACSDVVAVDEADLGVGDLLEQETALANVTGNDSANVEAVDVPGLNGVAPSTSNSDCTHCHSRARGLVSLEADTHATAEVHRDLAKVEVGRAKDSDGEIRVTSHGENGDGDVGNIGNLDTATAVSSVGVDGTAALECDATRDDDGGRADVARGDDRETLATRHVVEGGLDGDIVVVAAVDLGAGDGGHEVTLTGDGSIGGAGTTLGGHGSDECQHRREKRKLRHCGQIW